jgi:hypothetical protein
MTGRSAVSRALAAACKRSVNAPPPPTIIIAYLPPAAAWQQQPAAVAAEEEEEAEAEAEGQRCRPRPRHMQPFPQWRHRRSWRRPGGIYAWPARCVGEMGVDMEDD